MQETLDRETIFLAQTPQGFRRDVLARGRGARAVGCRSHRRGGAGRARRLPGAPRRRRRRTTSRSRRRRTSTRRASNASRGPRAPAGAGLGCDLHRLGAGASADSRRRHHPVGARRPGTLGCRRRVPRGDRRDPRRRRALATSAFIFPTPIPAGRVRRSLDLAAADAVSMAAESGFEVGNVDVDRDARVAEAARLTSIRSVSRSPRVLGIDADRISVKAKTNEGVDAIGRGEAIAAQAIALCGSRSLEPRCPKPSVMRVRFAPSPTGQLRTSATRGRRCSTGCCARGSRRTAAGDLRPAASRTPTSSDRPASPKTRSPATSAGSGLDWDEGPDAGRPSRSRTASRSACTCISHTRRSCSAPAPPITASARWSSSRRSVRRPGRRTSRAIFRARAAIFRRRR